MVDNTLLPRRSPKRSSLSKSRSRDRDEKRSKDLASVSEDDTKKTTENALEPTASSNGDIIFASKKDGRKSTRSISSSSSISTSSNSGGGGGNKQASVKQDAHGEHRHKDWLSGTGGLFSALSLIPTLGSGISIVYGLYKYTDRVSRLYNYVNWVISVWPMFFAFGHLAFPGTVASSMGWGAGNPFQSLVAVANLALGGTSIYVSETTFDLGAYRAVLLMWTLWLSGNFLVHLIDAVQRRTFAFNNAVAPLLFAAMNVTYSIYLLA